MICRNKEVNINYYRNLVDFFLKMKLFKLLLWEKGLLVEVYFCD